MTDPIFDGDDDGATPLSPEEREGLIPTWIANRADLNRAELDNIAQAQAWAGRRVVDVLDAEGLNDLHRRMYGKVWRWAGQRRTTGKNIGVDPIRIEVELRAVLDDAAFWLENATYEPTELMARFHHRLVWVHCYPNGNGRHARMAADLLARRLGVGPLTWGRDRLVRADEVRRRYISALQAADRHDYAPLLTFVGEG